jgi:radical SAM superfamily enzyme YgiQ (UPF0313 family)
MGIESGSERILSFYGRPTPVPLVEKAVDTLARFKLFHINPTYDIIVDNPIETRQDVIDTLELVYRMPRPFSLSIFSLRMIPNTKLEEQMRKHGLNLKRIDENYRALRPTFSNLLLCMLMVWRPPRRVFTRLLKRVRGSDEPQRSYPVLMQLVRIPWLILQGLRHLKHGEFTAITGRSGYLLWRLGILPLIRKISVRRFRVAAEFYR